MDHVTTILEFSFIKKHFQHFTTYCCLITAGWQKPHKNKYETSMMSNFITGLIWTQPAQTTCTEMTKWCLAAFHFSPYVLCFSVTVNTLPAKTPEPLSQLTTDPLLLYLHSCFPAPAFKNVLRKFQIVYFILIFKHKCLKLINLSLPNANNCCFSENVQIGLFNKTLLIHHKKLETTALFNTSLLSLPHTQLKRK